MKRRSREQISFNMSRIRSKGSQIENIMAAALKKAKIKFKDHLLITGKPDFAIVSPKKVAIFCDSAFWHGYKRMSTVRHKFRHRKIFWTKKILGNMLRDKAVNKLLRQEGWAVIRFWDFQINGNIDKCMERIKCTLDER